MYEISPDTLRTASVVEMGTGARVGLYSKATMASASMRASIICWRQQSGLAAYAHL